ncbi:hypothetical protein LA345_38755 (plasmid) [Burkholderia vietnamiensis]|uniref:Uncharacterized protein n=1 Tax=Burkholderia vietnamiensis (strain G4 / LMG 22486) TaxID=269482 RepID=A4JWB4_BURVG|nr:hypothetical protein Bcep1808_7697 [Burkholderia vietnamiensis G4]MCB4349739.1 hypothetical protein [Burkholderia vietnamiensis]
MSGRPNKEGIAGVLAHVRRANALREEQADLEQAVKAAEERLKTVREQIGKADALKLKAMAQMDVLHSGNFGFEQRLTAFLGELIRQAEQKDVAVANKGEAE